MMNKKKILDERAVKLSAVHKGETEHTHSDEFLSFKAGEFDYLLSAEYVVEVIKYKDVAPLPGVDRKLIGVFNFRGSILGIFEGEMLLNGTSSTISANNYIIVCGLGAILFAISCNEINGIQKRNLSELLENNSNDLLPSIITGVFADSARCIEFEKLITDASLKIS
jgi:chemotaxis signal transduction protein